MVLSWDIGPECYDKGVLETSKVIYFAEGYLPYEKNFRFNINKKWKPTNINCRNYGNTFEASNLVILQRDPQAPTHSYIHTDNTNTHREEASDLDKALKAGELGLMLKALGR